MPENVGSLLGLKEMSGSKVDSEVFEGSGQSLKILVQSLRPKIAGS